MEIFRTAGGEEEFHAKGYSIPAEAPVVTYRYPLAPYKNSFTDRILVIRVVGIHLVRSIWSKWWVYNNSHHIMVSYPPFPPLPGVGSALLYREVVG